MISVIIPTMWTPPTTKILLYRLCQEKFITQIVVIDNDKNNNPNYDILNHQKIQVETQIKNVFVNPAWNIGAQKCKNDIICIMNDDVILFDNPFEFVIKNMKYNTGVIGLNLQKDQPYLSIEPLENMKSVLAFGCVMFMKKENYFPIPDSLKVFYGDNYLFDKNKLQGNLNYVVNGVRNNKVFGLTSDSLFKLIGVHAHDMIKHEELIYNNIIQYQS
jgi:hypothetical protein